MADVFETERLTIRDWQANEVEAYFRIYGDPTFAAAFALPPLVDLTAGQESLDRRIENSQALGPGLGMWAIVPKSDGAPVGTVLLKHLPNDERIEIGWHLSPAVWGRGYATEAAGRVLSHGFDTLSLATIWAIIRPENVKSQAVARRLGMEITADTLIHVGMLHDYWKISGADWSEAMAILRSRR